MLSKPRNNISLEISLLNNNRVLSSSTLTFSPADFNVDKEVSITLNRDLSYDDKDEYVSISYLGKEIKKIHIIINNTDIKEKPSIIATDSITSKKNEKTSFSVSLSAKPEGKAEVFISSSSDKVIFDSDSVVFDQDNYKTEQAFFFTINESETASAISFTLSSSGLVSKSIEVLIEKIPEGKFEYLTPFESGFITNPVYYYTAYYDVDFQIDKLLIAFNGSESYKDIYEIPDSSFTNNACMISLSSLGFTSDPTVRLKAYYSNKIEKLTGEPTF